MKTPAGRARAAGKAKSKAGSTPRAGKSRKSATRPKSPPKKAAKVLAAANGGAEASRLIDQRIRELGGWRGATLARMRALILEADSGITEEWKWGGPVWAHHGVICTGEAYTKVVKLTFARGATIPDPSGLFNSSLTGSTRRAIDICEGEQVDARAFKALVKAAVARNSSSKEDATGRAGARRARPAKLLAGGNPQIPKADGDAPVEAYIAAMPGWKRDVGRRLDALIVRAVPGVRKAVRWNSPFYGVGDQGWFLAFHVFTRYVKVTFFSGTSLSPVPPGGTGKDARWIDIHEDDLDETAMTAWVKQAAALPGWVP